MKISHLHQITTLLLSLILFNSCEEPETGNVKITGTIEGVENFDEIYLFKITDKVLPFDTAKVSSGGSFEMVSQIEQGGFFRLGFSQNNNYLSMVIMPDDEISVTGQFGSLESRSEITGSPETEFLQEYFTSQTSFQSVRDSLQREMQYAQQNQDPNHYRQAFVNFRILEQRNKESVKELLEGNTDKIGALAALQNLEPEEDFELFQQVVEDLKDKMDHSPIYRNVAEQVNAISNTQVGAEAPEIELDSPDGEPVALSSLRGKYVLIDFWASWCKPCRIENPNVVRMYNRFKDQNFEIYGVSLDKEKSKWVKAIQEDNIEWVQVSDLKGWNCKGAKTYNVNAIPQTVLIDPEGIIIARNLRGNELEEKLEEVLFDKGA